MRTLRPDTAHSLLWSFLESTGATLLMLVTVLVIARLVGPADFGLAALALVIVGLMNLAVETLFHDAIVQRRDLHPDHVDSALWTATALGGLLAVGLWAGAPLVSAAFRMPALGPVTAWMGLSLLVSGAAGVLAGHCRREMQFKQVALRTLLGRLAGALIGVTLALRGFGVWSLVAQHLLGQVIGTLWLWIAASRRPRLAWSAPRLRELSRFALPAFLTQLSLTLNVRIFTMLLGYFLGAAALGQFALGVRLMDALWLALMSALYNVSLALFARIQDDLGRLRAAFVEVTQLTAVAVMPVFAGLIVTGDLLVHVLLGPAWLPAAPVIQMLAASSIVAALRYFAPVVYRAVGRPQLHLLSTSGGVVFTLAGLVLFARDSLLLAAAIWAGAVLINAPVSVLLIRRILGLRVREQFGGVGPPLAAAAAMAFVLFAIRWWWAPQWAPALVLALLVPLGAAIYGGLLLLTAPGQVMRLVRLARQIRHRREPVLPAASHPGE